MEKETKPKRKVTGAAAMGAGPGRKKGIPNKMSGLAKENIVSVFDKIGGIDRMAEWAIEFPTPFYSIYAKLLPIQITGEGGGPLQMIVEWQKPE